MELEMREPWIGERFEGLLLVGESHYGDKTDLELTRKVVGGIVGGTWRHKFFTSIEQVVTGAAARRLGSHSFWQTVAFANFCPGGVDGPGVGPTPEMWEAGRRFLPRLIERVRPRRILVLGNRVWDNFPSATPIRKLPAPRGKRRELARLTADTGPAADGVPLTSIRHPSAVGFSAAEWREVYLHLADAPAHPPDRDQDGG